MKAIPLHPETIKSLKKGHPWITRDEFSSKFPKKETLTIHDPKSNHVMGQFIHDPKHPKVVARAWSSEEGRFDTQLKEKLEIALNKRKDFLKLRDNVYLSFAEADELPGLFVQKLGSSLLIQYECFFWQNWLKKIIGFYDNKKELIGHKQYWIQERIPGEKKLIPTPWINRQKNSEIVIEGGIKFLVKFQAYHDIGLYTDMASIREKLSHYFINANHVLNLFSYTGAFSLLGLKNNAAVTSVDVSSKYMSWLEENIQLNEFEGHTSKVMACEKALDQHLKKGEKFDLIICDPPSFSSDKKKKQSAKDFYKTNLKKMANCLGPQGKAIIFLNTHKLTHKQFRTFIQENISPIQGLKIQEEIMMGQDCKPRPNFPEGNYLKCFVLGH